MQTHVYMLCSSVCTYVCAYTYINPYMCLYANTLACMCNVCEVSYSEEYVEDCGGVLLRLKRYRVQSKNVLVVIESYNPYKITSLWLGILKVPDPHMRKWSKSWIHAGVCVAYCGRNEGERSEKLQGKKVSQFYEGFSMKYFEQK